MSDESPQAQALEIARRVQAAAIAAALDGYQHAAISGLCHEGAWEAAISAIRMLDLEALVRDPGDPDRASGK